MQGHAAFSVPAGPADLKALVKAEPLRAQLTLQLDGKGAGLPGARIHSAGRALPEHVVEPLDVPALRRRDAGGGRRGQKQRQKGNRNSREFVLGHAAKLIQINRKVN